MRRSRRRSRPRRTHDRTDDRAMDDEGDRSSHARLRRWAAAGRRSPASRSTAAPSLRAKLISPSRATSMTAMISSPPRSRPAPASRWSPRSAPSATPSATTRRSSSSTTCSRRCAISRAAARARSAARIVAVTGSVGKTSTKEALALALGADGETHASAASFNNHWGVPLSLARLPQSARYGVFEIGMNHAGEITPLTRLVRPHVAIVTTVEPVHLEFFSSVAAIADAKAEIFLGARARRRGGHQPRQSAISSGSRAAPRRRASSASSRSARTPAPTRGSIKCALQADGSTVEASILGVPVAYKVGAPGKHLVMNSLAVLAAASLCGADLALRRRSRWRGRRRRPDAAPASRSNCRTVRRSLIDESYNANPDLDARRAGAARPGAARPARAAHRRARRHAGARPGRGRAASRPASSRIGANEVDLVFCAGPLMACLVAGSSIRAPGRLCE